MPRPLTFHISNEESESRTKQEMWLISRFIFYPDKETSRISEEWHTHA